MIELEIFNSDYLNLIFSIPEIIIILSRGNVSISLCRYEEEREKSYGARSVGNFGNIEANTKVNEVRKLLSQA